MVQEHLWVHDICCWCLVNPKNSLGRVRYDTFVMQLGGVPSTSRVASQNYHTARGPRTFLGSRHMCEPENSLGRVRYDNFVMQRGWCSPSCIKVHTAQCPPSCMSTVQGPRSKARVLHVHTSTLVARGLWSEVCGLWSEGSVVRGLWSKSICGFTTFVVGAW